MEKLDLTKKYKTYYSAKAKPELTEFGNIQYLTIKGKGEPAGKEFDEKTATLYPVAYGIKKICKAQSKDFAVPKLEGLWWADSSKPFLSVPRSEWQWKLLIRMPDFVTSKMLTQSLNDLVKAKKIKSDYDIILETINEGKLINILHTGPYSAEPATIAHMDSFIKENKLSKNGLHHEIYLSDPNKTEPSKMKTILRQPVK